MKILSKRSRVDINLAEEPITYKIKRLPRQTFFIDVGDMGKEQVKEYLETVKKKVCPFTDAAFAGGYDPTAGIKEYMETRFLSEYKDTRLVAELTRCKNDPAYFISTYCKVQHPTQGEAYLSLRSYQQDLVQQVEANQGLIVKHPRQAGITSTALAYALWMACFHPCKSILLGTVSHAQAMDLRSRLSFMLERLPEWMVPGIKYTNKHSTEFDNGSAIRYQAVSESFGRGISFSLCYLDSFAFVKPEMQEYVWDCIVPTVMAGGKLIVASTPDETNTCFHSLWCNAVEGLGPLMPFSVQFNELPQAVTINADNLKQIIGEVAFKRQYLAEFVDVSPVKVDLLDKITGIVPSPRPAGFLWQLPSPDERDLGIGEGRFR